MKKSLTVAILCAILTLMLASAGVADVCDFCNWKFVCYSHADCDVINICEAGQLISFEECWSDGYNCYMSGPRCTLA